MQMCANGHAPFNHDEFLCPICVGRLEMQQAEDALVAIKAAVRAADDSPLKDAVLSILRALPWDVPSYGHEQKGPRRRAMSVLDRLLLELRDLVELGDDRYAAAVLTALHRAADNYADPDGASGRTCMKIAALTHTLLED